MGIILLTFVLASGCSAIASWILVRRGGLAFDLPNSRSSHTTPTPRGGGLAFFTAIAMVLAAVYTVEPELITAVPWIFVLCWGLIFVLGLCEDRYELGAKLRLIVQVGLATAIVSQGYFWNFCDQFGIMFSYSEWLDRVATIFLIVWVVNLYNFMDGINGIATLQGIAVSILYTGLGIALDIPFFIVIGVALCGALVAFLPFNFPQAKIFMGDSGSLFLGFLIITLPLTHNVVRGYNFPFAILSIAPFFVDAFITIVRRLAKGEAILKPHRSHFYQKLQIILKGHTLVTLLYFLFASLFAGICYWKIYSETIYIYGAVAGLAILLLFFSGIHYATSKK